MKKPRIIGLYILATYVVTLVLTLSASVLLNAIAQAVPAIVAVVFLIFSKNPKAEIKNSGILHLGHIKWYLIAIVVPCLAITISYFAATYSGFFNLQLHLPWLTFIYRVMLSIFMWPLIWAIGEEVGWRGYLQPGLTALVGVRQGLFITGIVWACWHLIFIFWGGYYTSGNMLINTSFLLITVTLMAFFIGWIRLKSQSIWPCVVFHSASNAAWQMWSFQFKILSPNSMYFAGEAGLFNIIFWAVCLLFIWKKL